MTHKELIENSFEENCFDNPTLDENITTSNVIFVQSKPIGDGSFRDQLWAHHVPKADSQDLPITPRDIVNESDKESSCDSIEIVNIDDPSWDTKTKKPYQYVDVQGESERDVGNTSTTGIKMESKKEQRKQLARTDSRNIFEDEHIFSDVMANPSANIQIINPKDDLIQFLFSPPPRDVVVKCQLNKTNRKDKTNLFTKFIFSLQINRRNENQKCGLFTLMAARSRKKTKTAHYIISTDVSEMKSNSSTIIGKMRGNLFGTQFRFYQYKRPVIGNVSNYAEEEENGSEDNVSEIESASTYAHLKDTNIIGATFYKHTASIKQRPRRVNVVLPPWDDQESAYSTEAQLLTDKGEVYSDSHTYKLENIEPTFSKELKCFTLDFGGRAKKTSVKNFALKMNVDGKEKRVYQFGKCPDHYIVDYTYPLCAFQAFLIGLSSCHRKLVTD